MLLAIPISMFSKRRLLGLATVVTATALVACGDDAAGPENQSPSVTITTPSSGAEFVVGDPVGFRGSAIDPEDGALTGASLEWVSSIDGLFQTGGVVEYNALALGEHTIWLRATDSQGATDSASVSVIVAAAPEPGVVVEDSAGSIFRTLRVGLEAPAAIQVDYWSAETPRLRVTSPAQTSRHRVFLPRLKASLWYDYEVRAAGGADPSILYSGRFQTDTLPSSVSAIQFFAEGTPTSTLTMIEARTPFAQVIVDQDGEVVWFRIGAETKKTTGFTRLANGDFVFNDWEELSVETPESRVVARLPRIAGMGQMHHDVVTTAQNTVLFLAQEPGLVNDTMWIGEAVWEWDPEFDVLVKRWSSFDFLSPDVDRGPRTKTTDWLHANSLAIGPRGNVLVSMMWTQEVVSIAPDYQSLEWRLGGPASSFVVAGGAMDGGQHTAGEVRPGRVLMFDNGQDRPDSTFFSRALEIRLDERAGTAEAIWEFRLQPDMYAGAQGSARRLGNGNTVVAFALAEGVFDATGPIIVYEVTPSSQVVWSLRVEGVRMIYRATPMAHVGGEEVVGPAVMRAHAPD